MRFSELRGFSEVRLTVTCRIGQGDLSQEICVLNADALKKAEQSTLRHVASTWIDELEGVTGYPQRGNLHVDMY